MRVTPIYWGMGTIVKFPFQYLLSLRKFIHVAALLCVIPHKRLKVKAKVILHTVQLAVVMSYGITWK